MVGAQPPYLEVKPPNLSNVDLDGQANVVVVDDEEAFYEDDGDEGDDDETQEAEEADVNINKRLKLNPDGNVPEDNDGNPGGSAPGRNHLPLLRIPTTSPSYSQEVVIDDDDDDCDPGGNAPANGTPLDPDWGPVSSDSETFETDAPQETITQDDSIDQSSACDSDVRRGNPKKWAELWRKMALKAVDNVKNQESDITGLVASIGSAIRTDAVFEEKALEKGVIVSFCVACYKRGWQLRKTLLSNILALLPWRKNCRICIALFRSEESDDDIAWIMDNAAGALADASLVVGLADMPGNGWDASLAKNTSHRLAVKEHDQGLKVFRLSEGPSSEVKWKEKTHFLINLDADNLIAPTFMDEVKKAMTQGKLKQSNACLWGKGRNNGTCGRIGMWAEDFARLGGYDQTLLPTGYEDVDLVKRCEHIAKKGKTIFMQDQHVGTSIPNDMTSKKIALGNAKVAHVSEKHKGMNYHEMNQKNLEDCRQKLNKGQWCRNLKEPPPLFCSLDEQRMNDIFDCLGVEIQIVAGGCAGPGTTEHAMLQSPLTSQDSQAGGSAPPPVAGGSVVQVAGGSAPPRRLTPRGSVAQVAGGSAPPSQVAIPKARPVRKDLQATNPYLTATDQPGQLTPRAQHQRPDQPVQLTPRAPHQQPKQIQVMSMGVVIANDTVHKSWTAKQLSRNAQEKGRGRGLGPVIDETLIEKLLKEAEVLRPGDKLLIVDCRQFSDPDQQHNRRHIGLHSAKVRAFVLAEHVFKGWLTKVKLGVLRHYQSLDPGCRLVIVTYCRKGAHRSVSGARIIDYCVQEKVTGAHVLPIHHFSKEHIWKLHYCGECNECIASANKQEMSEA